ncbi:MAG: hypothetical protein WC453_00405 [Patescibacteria group bacterium]
MSVDYRLLNQNNNAERAADRAGNLRAAQRGSDSDASGDMGASGEAEQPRSLREMVLARKRELALAEAKGEAAGGLAGAATAPVRRGTSKLLQQSWLNLIDSFGLTLIWINIHVFLKMVVGEKFFCKLGEEWASLVPGGEADPLAKEAAAKFGKPIGTVEAIALALCDLILLLLILAIISLVAMIVGVMENPLKAIMALLKTITGSMWE